MEQFKKLIKEINENINNVIIFNALVRASLFFLVLYFILSLFNFFPFYALVPSIMYLVILLYLNFSKNKAKIIESKYPTLREKLITAFDYKNVENPVVNELHEEIIQDMRSVRLSSFINQKRIAMRIFFVVLLSFTIMIFSLFNITVYDLGSKYSEWRDTPDILEDVFSHREEFLQDIFGEESEVNFGTEKIDVEIRPIGFEVDVRQLSEIPEETFGENSFPQEVFVQSAESFQEDFSADQAELVKEYFEKMSKI